MEDKNNILDWLSNWFASECDGDWEHEYGVKIETIDNPGWSVEIDLKFTEYENIEIPWKLVENLENNWFGVSVKDGRFNAAGDPSKLTFLIEKFKEIVENHDFKKRN